MHNKYRRSLAWDWMGGGCGHFLKIPSLSCIKDFEVKVSQTAVGTFGSGWAWLVIDKDNKMEIVSKSNAGNPMNDGKKPILTCDIWEHAYYIDYRNARPIYVEKFWDLVNWDFVNSNL